MDVESRISYCVTNSPLGSLTSYWAVSVSWPLLAFHLSETVVTVNDWSIPS